MKRIIEFVTKTDAIATDLFVPAKASGKPPYEDLLLTPEYKSRRFAFPRGKTCVRILPQVVGSSGWMQGMSVLSHPNGRHAKSVDTGAENVFGIAYRWIQKNEPSLLYSKANRDGYRLLPSPMSVCWLLIEIDGEMKAKLFLGSAYDGLRGENCGIAHQLFRIARELDQPGGHDAADSDYGVQITVEKTIPPGEEYPNYQITRHHQAVPIQRYLDRMSESEVNAICPLQEVIHSVDSRQEWELLAKVIGTELSDQIREATCGASEPSIASDEPPDE